MKVVCKTECLNYRVVIFLTNFIAFAFSRSDLISFIIKELNKFMCTEKKHYSLSNCKKYDKTERATRVII